MGRRGSTETITRIYEAFARKPTWRQAELAREVDVTVKSLRRALDNLSAAGMPLSDERDGNNTYWSVPGSWQRGGVLIPRELLTDLVHAVARLPRGELRQKLLQHILGDSAGFAELRRMPEVIDTPERTPEEEAAQTQLEEAAAASRSLEIFYFSNNSGRDWRHISPHRVLDGPPARVVATCHRAQALRWFRVDHVERARASQEAYSPASAAAVDTFMSETVGAYHAPGPAKCHVFYVRDPEAHWVRDNLPRGLSGTRDARGLRVIGTTASVRQIARYVIGLGAAARAETEELRVKVRELAEGALKDEE